MKKSFIAFHKEKGIYLGVFAGYGIFSTDNLVYTTKAIRFDDAEELQELFSSIVPSLAKEIIAVPVNTKSEGHYVDVIDIIKSGHKKHTESLVENILMKNENIH
jgi:hypothetical protein